MSEISLATELAWTTVLASNAAYDQLAALQDTPGQEAERAAAEQEFKFLQDLGAPAAALIASTFESGETDNATTAETNDYGASSPPVSAIVSLSGALAVSAENAPQAAEALRFRASVLFGGFAAHNNFTIDMQSLGEVMSANELDRPIATVFGDRLDPENPMTARLINCLGRDHIGTLREVLAMGKNKIREIRNLGGKCVEILDHVLQEIDPEITWNRQPTTHDIVMLYEGWEQVPARVLDGDDAKRLRGVTMHALAHSDPEDLGRLGSEAAAALQKAARQFAQSFSAAKAQIAAERS